MSNNKRTHKPLSTLNIGDTVEVMVRHKLFGNTVGEVYDIEGESVYVEFINSGCYLGSGVYQRYELKPCASLIPLGVYH